jgi:hypothetical protein
MRISARWLRRWAVAVIVLGWGCVAGVLIAGVIYAVPAIPLVAILALFAINAVVLTVRMARVLRTVRPADG